MFDILIQGGRVVDGSGNPWYYGDVGISAGQIAAIGRLASADARHRIDASDKVVAPGFIDAQPKTGTQQQQARQRDERHIIVAAASDKVSEGHGTHDSAKL